MQGRTLGGAGRAAEGDALDNANRLVDRQWFDAAVAGVVIFDLTQWSSLPEPLEPTIAKNPKGISHDRQDGAYCC